MEGRKTGSSRPREHRKVKVSIEDERKRGEPLTSVEVPRFVASYGNIQTRMVSSSGNDIISAINVLKQRKIAILGGLPAKLFGEVFKVYMCAGRVVKG